ncbi:MAG: hypothetical protein ACTHK4_03290, partial [Mycobacteriales bacterium]
MKRLISLATAATVAGLTLVGTGGAANAAKGRVLLVRSGHGIVVKSVKALDSRQILATITPAALAPRSIAVRILLPVNYSPDAKPYPVLYLYPGTSGDNSDWVNAGDALKTTAPYRLITVSSDIG